MNTTSRIYYDNGDIDYSQVMLEDPPRFIPYSFEEIDYLYWMAYCKDKWYLPIYVGTVYIFLIFGIRHLMKSRKAFDLKRELFLWNAALGIFSILGFMRFAPEFCYQLSQTNGFFETNCIWKGVNKPAIFWGILFMFSKFFELGDTLFIVLRKKSLQFIQWYHHIITLTVCWITFAYAEPIARYYGIMNYGVHSLMYPYFAVRALDIKIPRSIANLITTLQLVQMLIGLYVNSYSGYLFYSGVECRRHPNSIKLFSLVYGSFVLLFGKLYYNLVIRKQRKKTE